MGEAAAGEGGGVRGGRRGSGSGRFGGKTVSGQRGQQVDLSLREGFFLDGGGGVSKQL